ncbi:MAG: hypothetical protein KF757_04790 [Phycisphaeraceae bacterium]|nr:hypothetical protein [Phycisphaeraceae bacterium]MCW5763913.1 hypothetical protein [Phycisphaeraceae bacterium]
MKNVLAWIKARILIVALSVLMLAMLPTAFIISGKLNKDLRERQTKAFNDEKSRINRAAKVDYKLPRISASESDAALSESRPPNDFVTTWYAEQREARLAQAERVAAATLTLNRAEHGPLIDTFPPPRRSDDRTVGRRAAVDLARAITGQGRGASGRSAYDTLFERFGAGMPPSRQSVARAVADYETRELDAIQNRAPGGRVTPEARDTLSKQLVDRRLSEYRRHAEQFSFYGSSASLFAPQQLGQAPGQRPGSSDARPTSPFLAAIPERPTVEEAYIWQWDYWIVSDLLRAVARANRDQTGDATPVRLSVVKRVESISIDAFNMPRAQSLGDMGADAGMDMMGGFGDMRGSQPAAGGELTAPRVTLTGRSGSSVFDIRHARIVVIASSERLPVFLNAIKTTNLMTVTDLDIERIDVYNDLRDGFFYGDEHVVRATIEVETVWLRDWTRNFMPDAVRTAFGITD